MYQQPDRSDAGQYGASFADVYDEWYADMPVADLVAFVSARAAAGADVTELGVGTGRVAVALADAGFAVTGVDSSPQMLARLDDKAGARVRGVSADAADPDGAAYPTSSADVVLAVFNLVFNLAGEDAQRACFRGCAQALRPGGFLVVEAFVPDRFGERRRELVTRSVEPGRVVLIATDGDPLSRVVSGSHIEITDAGTRLRPWTIRVADPAELDAMATAAGLCLTERFEDFAGTPFVDGDSVHHVSVYRAGEAG